MRDLFKTVMTGAMVAGAALVVAACGGSKDNTANNVSNVATDDMSAGNTGDVTSLDATGNAAGSNLGAAAGTSTTSNTTSTTTTNSSGTGNVTTGAGTGNPTGM